ncbi:calmodulin-lysine N-methyltransferase-like protein [Lates japonicus]|uniref:Calmodulin-lysine N-methyltransferase-like protein n=1 Tax=Lates japonicus TaxID=270547 RepID=A0AAD3N168_LATJO|nr:calmodulin-lysine N-methyltransferase-like protein [Lates japonicus]
MAAQTWGASDLPMGFMENGGPAGLLRARMEASMGPVRDSSKLLRSRSQPEEGEATQTAAFKLLRDLKDEVKTFLARGGATG